MTYVKINIIKNNDTRGWVQFKRRIYQTQFLLKAALPQSIKKFLQTWKQNIQVMMYVSASGTIYFDTIFFETCTFLLEYVNTEYCLFRLFQNVKSNTSIHGFHSLTWLKLPDCIWIDVEVGGERVKASLTATVGLVVHAAVDGVALGAAATTTQTDVEMVVFAAIMLHKVRQSCKLLRYIIL